MPALGCGGVSNSIGHRCPIRLDPRESKRRAAPILQEPRVVVYRLVDTVAAELCAGMT
jgi:hypothetical protein